VLDVLHNLSFISTLAILLLFFHIILLTEISVRIHISLVCKSSIIPPSKRPVWLFQLTW